MRIARKQHDVSAMEKALDLVYGVLGRVHGFVSVALAWLCRRLDRGLSGIAWSCKLGLVAVLLGGTAFHCGQSGLTWYRGFAQLTPEHLKVLGEAGIMGGWAVFSPLLFAVGILLMLCSLLALWRHWITHLVLKVAAAAYVVVALWVLGFIIRVPAVLLAECDKELFAPEMRNALWMTGFAAWLAVSGVGCVFVLSLSLRSVSVFYGSGSKATVGDAIVDNLRTHGKDPNYRTSLYWSAFIHIFFLFLLPLLMLLGMWQKAYAIPKGSGNPVAQLIKVQKIKKKPEQKFVFNPNSAIVFWTPDIEDSEIMEEVDKLTENQYEATALVGGKLGKGGGKRGGWPNGMENAKVRFIRLKYSGGDWDQQMGKGADYNFLINFSEMTGFKIANETEAVTVADLKRFPKHRAPPFVYLTGSRNISLSQREIKILRWYLLEEGGMIFADNGGGSFDRALASVMRRVLPEKRWIDIANDDILYRQPYVFPSGAPPLWHHSGSRAKGMKHNGRWVVFYHQGDINDAWQTGGSGVKAGTRKRAFEMGINVVNYAFNQYLSLHFGD